MELAWARDNKRYVSPDGSGYRWTAEAEAGGVKVSARIVTEPFGSPGRYRLALSVNGAALPPSEHERLQWAQEEAAEYCETLAGLRERQGPRRRIDAVTVALAAQEASGQWGHLNLDGTRELRAQSMPDE